MRGARQSPTICGLLVLTLFATARIDSQVNPAPPYSLGVAVDEVILTFHAADAHGLAINDLKLDEVGLLDNDKPPRKIIAFQLMQNFPIRAGILIDTSGSMGGHLAGNRAIAIQYAQSILRKQTDQAFIMDFGHLSRILQPWTNDSTALTAGIRKITAGGESRVAGTTVFDTIYRACSNLFGGIDHVTSGNFILLFSDGEDNASYFGLKDAVDACQRTNTAIYAFRADPKEGFGSTGPGTLVALTDQTGGRVFHDDESAAGIYDDLRIIEGDLRDQYRLIYRPGDFKHDGSFHRVVLIPPERVKSVVIRSGYYAPVR